MIDNNKLWAAEDAAEKAGKGSKEELELEKIKKEVAEKDQKRDDIQAEKRSKFKRHGYWVIRNKPKPPKFKESEDKAAKKR